MFDNPLLFLCGFIIFILIMLLIMLLGFVTIKWREK